ncbi:MAG: hypothetical protein LBC77_03490 [Spirochaetaceae bacterium]|jgi:hypothetical protein|nr:hypothetical protein [Spirochaetaceae bacterium]
MPRQFFYAVIAAGLMFLGGCGDLFQKQLFKSVFITDITQSQPQIKSLEGDYIILALFETVPDLTQITGSDLISMPYSIGRVDNGKINVRMSTGVDYWSGSGNFWVAFFVPDGRAERISWAYLSTSEIEIKNETTYLYNNDFMPGSLINLDLSGFFPF